MKKFILSSAIIFLFGLNSCSKGSIEPQTPTNNQDYVKVQLDNKWLLLQNQQSNFVLDCNDNFVNGNGDSISTYKGFVINSQIAFFLKFRLKNPKTIEEKIAFLQKNAQNLTFCDENPEGVLIEFLTNIQQKENSFTYNLQSSDFHRQTEKYVEITKIEKAGENAFTIEAKFHDVIIEQSETQNVQTINGSCRLTVSL